MKNKRGYRTALTMGFVAGVLGTNMAAPLTAQAATVTQIMNFGSNPSGIGMYLYTPANVVAKPPILVGVHACHSMGLSVCTPNHPFAQQADKYGFLLVCPSAVSSDGCWDVHSAADLSHTGRGDASGIISMVNYVIQNNKGDASRVYVAGHSSGGMMTNVLLGSYPDVFKAGAAFAGVAFACFAQGSVDPMTGWSSTCANGNVTMTGAQWGALVRGAYPGFTGTRPRIQLWHGTVDATVAFHNFGEEIKEWTNVLGVSETPASTENNALQATWIRTRYPDAAGVVQVEAIQETGQPHNLVINGAEAIHFFGLDGSNPAPVPDAGAGGTVKDGGAVADAGLSDGAARSDATTGSTSGGTATGGAIGTGGALAGTGGSTGTGGVLATGGSSATPGSSATGGSSSPSPASPDAGSTTGNGASSGSTSGAPPSANGSSSASGCSVVSRDTHRLPPPTGLVFLLGSLFVGWRRRRGAERSTGEE